MANKGRIYERLFERDFGLRTLTSYGYLPRTWKMPPFPGIASNCIRFTNTIEQSSVGVADYVNGKVVWEWHPAAAITPGAYARLEWELTFDADFARYFTYWGIGSTDWYRTYGTVPLTTFPSLTNFPFLDWIITPTPTCTPGRVGFSPWRWVD